MWGLSHVFLTRFLSRISALLIDMDAARLLHWRSFAAETVEKRIEELRKKVVYIKRSKSMYEKIFELSVQDLHSQAGSKTKICFFFVLSSLIDLLDPGPGQTELVGKDAQRHDSIHGAVLLHGGQALSGH